MVRFFNAATLRNVVVGLFSSAILSGCFLSEEEADKVVVAGTDVSLSGSVGDGPVVDAQMSVKSVDGRMLAEFQSDAQAGYNVTVTADDNAYPLIIDANGGIDLVTGLAPDFSLAGALLQSGNNNVANVNPFSTFTLAMARQSSGGLTSTNIEDAAQVVTTVLNSGLSSLVASGPMDIQIDASNVSEIVKSSEVLAERVRRTRDSLQSAGFGSSGNQVVTELAADLSDGVIDGVSSSGADARTAAVSTIVDAQVLLEAMANELRVNGIDATNAMRTAIEQVSDQTPSPTIDELLVTAEMRFRARIGLAAAHAVDPDPAIRQLHTMVSDMQPGQNAALVRVLLPSGYRNTLGNALSATAGGDEATLALVNAIARSNGDIDAPNLPPSIEGAAPTTATVGANYSFTPAAADVDGDVLTFSIANAPNWANFNTATGELNGTPQTNDIGSHNDIVISVSDGEFTADLPAFSIEVSEFNEAPQISGSAQTSVVVDSSYSFTPTASDADGDTLTFSITAQPVWASFDSATGLLSGTPGTADVGNYDNIVISVSDGALSDSLAPFSIAVTDVSSNTAPQISGTAPTTVREGESYSFTPTASDADGDSLTFSVSGLPAWASFDSQSGSISGIPASDDVGVYTNISIDVSDGVATSSLGAFDITVEAVSLGSVTLSWDAPTQNMDGTPLTDLVGYRIYWGTSAGYYPNTVRIDNPSISTYVVDNLPSGTYEFVATAVNSAGAESGFSNPATKVVP